jgi:glycosyltransferase involved in cell wall biosynthesis
MRLVHVITGLAVGGAETMLRKLLCVTDRERFDPVVVSLIPGGEIGDLLKADGIPVLNAGITGLADLPGGIWRLRALARDLEPRIIQGWMYHGNLAASLMAAFSPGNPGLFWNIRHSVDDLRNEKATTRFVIRLGSRFSGQPRRIIVNSSASVGQHVGLGYRADKCLMIPNGFDTAALRPDPRARLALREELGIDGTAPVVGMVARRHPMKGHEDFLEACAMVAVGNPDARFVLAGRGVTMEDPGLAKSAAAPELAGRVHLLGQRGDAASLMAGLDVLCLSSRFGEGFPNVLGEAMSCGVPCVSTDVGEAAAIIGPVGEVVPARDIAALAAGITKILTMADDERAALGDAARQRIVDRYSLGEVARRYEELYASR